MLAFLYFPQCLIICCSKFIQLYVESVFQLPLKLRSVWHFLLITTLALFSLATALFHISIVFVERIILSSFISFGTHKMVYIVGAPRSGTTRMHKLLASDQAKFTAMKMWECFFAPSIFQKKIFGVFSRIDRIFKFKISDAIVNTERNLFSKFNNIHALSLFNVEEDGLVLFHLFYSYHLSFLLGKESSYSNLNRNKNIPKAVWMYYQYCIENHQLQNKGKIYLAKNPFFTAHTNSLKSLFPKIQFINLTRDIEEVAPSFFSMKRHLSTVFYGCDPSQKKYKEILELLKFWQQSGLEITVNNVQVDYLNLKNSPSKIIIELYNFLELNLKEAQKQSLFLEDEKSKNYKSKHKYKPGEFTKD